MKVRVKPGKYVLAVSGGVDSMVLLDLLAGKPDIELVVAHFNHGIRDDSSEDEALVRQAASKYGLQYEVGYGKLGAKTSEEIARNARYKFLQSVKKAHKADFIITAHHQDDLIETVLINILRGTNRKGLSAIANNKDIIRPLLGKTKEEIRNYAKLNKIQWREDSTNTDETYLRNYLRKNILNELSGQQRKLLISNIDKVAKTNEQIDNIIANLSQNITNNGQINRSSFASLPLNLEDELVAYWLRQNKLRDFDKKTIQRLNIAIKTAKPGTIYPIQRGIDLNISLKTAQFITRV